MINIKAIIVAFVLLLLRGSNAFAADDVSVPPILQVQLLTKLLPYERNFDARAGDHVHVLIVAKGQSALSLRTQGQLLHALQEVPSLGGLPHSEISLFYRSTQELMAQIKGMHSTLLYLMPGFSSEQVQEIATALIGTDILSVSAAASDVATGMVLSFDLVSGKPVIQINIAQAKRQHVDFTSSLLGLARVIQ